MARKPPLKREEVERVLVGLESLTAERRIVLIGGQAVALWSAFFRLPEATDDEGIYTSADIDFEGAATSARKAGDLLNATVRIPTMDDHTPNTGIVIFEDGDGYKREIDFLAAPGGLTARDVRRTAVEIKIELSGGKREAPVLVLNPERCMESRIYNVMELKQRGRIAMDQLRRSVVCSREYARYLLQAPGPRKRERTRDVLKLNERVYRKCKRDRRFRDIYLEFDVDPFEAVIAEEGLPHAFLKKRYPQMVARLEAQREQDRVHRRRYAHTLDTG